MTDVFPRRNLNPEAEEWGREVQRRIVRLENDTATESQSVQGLNRSSAATLDDLANQLKRLDEQVQAVQDLYDQLPKAQQSTGYNSNFSLSPGWNSVVAVSFTAPGPGLFTLSASAHGQLVSGSTSSNVQATIRLAAGGSPSPGVPGLFASPDGIWVNNMMAGWGWVIPVVANQVVTVYAQVNPTDAGAWGAGTGSHMALSAFGTFRGPA